MVRLSECVILLTLFLLVEGREWLTLDGKPTVLYGHQGEKVIFPAHTLPGYEVAAVLAADYVEPDLAITKDGVLVCYHDLVLKSGTNVGDHPEFEHYMRNFTGVIGIVNETIVNDFFIENFTLAELRTLRVVQKPDGIRLQYFNDHFEIPTFDEYLQVIHKMTYTLNRTIGIIPELKHPPWHNRIWGDHFMENLLLTKLRAYGYPVNGGNGSCFTFHDYVKRNISCPHVIIQNFDKAALDYISTQTSLDLMVVVHPELTLLTYSGLDSIAKIAKYYCVWKEYMYVGVEAELAYNNKTYDAELIESLGGFIRHEDFVREAHSRGLRMTIFTINDSRENSRRGCAVVPGCEEEDKKAELFFFFERGLDAMFIESIAETRELRMIFDLS